MSSMPTRTISLTPQQDAFIDAVLEAGEYSDASDAMRDAVRALQQRRAVEALKLDRLRLAIQEGIAALDRGDYTEVDKRIWMIIWTALLHPSALDPTWRYTGFPNQRRPTSPRY